MDNWIYIKNGKTIICGGDPGKGGVAICGNASDLDEDDHYATGETTKDPITCPHCIKTLKSYAKIAKANNIKV